MTHIDNNIQNGYLRRRGWRWKSINATLLLIVCGSIIFSSLLVFAQNFEANIDLDPKRENQKVLEINIEPNYNETIPVQVFVRDVRGANRFLLNLQYDKKQLRFDHFEDGRIVPYSQSHIDFRSHSSIENLESVIIDTESFWGSVNRITGLLGTVHFRAVSPFEGARVILKESGMVRYGRKTMIRPDQIGIFYLSALVAADFDQSGVVDDIDLKMIVDALGTKGDRPFDLNNDNIIDGEDLGIFYQQYGKVSNRLPHHNLRYILDENTEGRVPVGDPITLYGAVSHEITTYTRDYFDIDYDKGQIYTKEDVKYDYEDKKYYSLTVKVVHEDRRLTEHVRLVIDINNIREPPSSPPKSGFLMVPGERSLSFHFGSVPNEEGKRAVRGYYTELRVGTDGKWGERRTIHRRNNDSVYYTRLRDFPQYTDDRLKNGQDYYIRVAAWNAEGHSPWSEPFLGIPVDEPDYPGRVDRPLITNLSPTSIRVKWEPPKKDARGVINYDIRYIIRTAKDKSDINWTVIEDAVKNKDEFYEEREYVLTGLVPGAEYYIQVRAKNDDGPSSWSDANLIRFEDNVQPHTPLHPFLINAGIEYLDIGWRLSSSSDTRNVLNYDIRYIIDSAKDKSEEYWTVLSDVLQEQTQQEVGIVVQSSGLYDLRYRTSGLEENKQYLVQVRSKNINGHSFWSHASLMRTSKGNVPKRPDPPVLLLASSDFLDVGWIKHDSNNPEGITDYDLRYILKSAPNKSEQYWRLYEDISSDLVEGTNLGPVLESGSLYNVIYKIDGLESEEEYYVQIRSKNSYGSSNWSVAVVMTTITGQIPLSQTRHPILITAGTNYLEIGWELPPEGRRNGLINYDVRYILSSVTDKSDDTKWSVLPDVLGQNPFGQDGGLVVEPSGLYDLKYTIRDLSQNESYLVQIRVKSSNGNGTWSYATRMKTLQSNVPNQPSPPVLVLASTNFLEVGWKLHSPNNPEGITEYHIRYILKSAEDKSDKYWTVLDNVLSSAKDPDLGAIVQPDGSYDIVSRISDLMSDKEYFVQIQSENTQGKSNWSRVSAMKTLKRDLPDQPLHSVLVIAGIDFLEIGWKVPNPGNSEGIINYDIRYILNSASDKSDASPAWEVVLNVLGDNPSQDGVGFVVQTGDLYDVKYKIMGLTENELYLVQVRAINAKNEKSVWSNSTKMKTLKSDVPSRPPSLVAVSAGIDFLEVGWQSYPNNNPEGITNYDIRYILSSAEDKSDENWTKLLNIKDDAVKDDNIGTLLVDGRIYDTVYKIESLQSNVEYLVQIRTKNDEGSSNWSPAAPMTSSAVIIPDKPTHPILVIAGETFLDIGWDLPPPANRKGLANYDIRYILSSATDKSDTQWDSLISVLPNDISETGVGVIVESGGLYDLKHRISSLTENEEYLVQLRGTSANRRSPWSDASRMSTLKSNVPSQLSSPILVSAGTNYLDIGWRLHPSTNPENITAYHIRYILKSAPDKSDANWTVKEDALSAGTKTSVGTVDQSGNPYDIVYRLDNLQSGVEYYVQVKAINSHGDGNWSYAVVMSTTRQSVPDQPIRPILVVADTDYLEVGWKFPAPRNRKGLKNYNIRYILNSAADKSDNSSEWNLISNVLGNNPSQDGVGFVVQSGSLYDVKYKITELTTNEIYLVQLQAVSDNGESPWSDSSQMKTLKNNAPSQPLPPVMVLASSDYINVGWKLYPPENPENITEYDLRYILTSAPDKADNFWTTVIDIMGQGTNVGTIVQSNEIYDMVYKLSGLGTAKEYFVQVRAKKGAVTGSWSYATIMETIPVILPSIPASPILVLAGTDFLDVGWTLPSPNSLENVTNYDLQYKLSTEISWTTETDVISGGVSANTIVSSSGIYDLSYRIESLLPNKVYHVQVKAKNANGSSDWSRTANMNTLRQNTPSQPLSPTLVLAGSKFLDVGWKLYPPNNHEKITNYDIRYIKESSSDKSDSSTDWVLEENVLDISDATLGEVVDPNISYDVVYRIPSPGNAELTPNKEYYVQIRAKNDQGSGSWSYVASMTTLPLRRPSKPLHPVLVLAGIDFLEIGWKVPTNSLEGVTDYNIRYILSSTEDKSDTNWETVLGVFSGGISQDNSVLESEGFYDLKYRITESLTEDEEYLVQVQSVNENGVSPWSNASRMKTLKNKVPSQPERLILVKADSEFLDVGWKLPSSESSESVERYDIRHIPASATNKADDSTDWTTVLNVVDMRYKDTSLGTIVESSPHYDIIYRILSLSPDNEYYVQLRAVNKHGESNWSQVAFMNTVPLVLPEVPESPVLVVATTTTVEVGWKIPADNGEKIVSYNIRYIPNDASDKSDTSTEWQSSGDIAVSDLSDPDIGLIVSASDIYDFKYEISNLIADKEYLVQVKASNKDRSSDWSNASLMRTLKNNVPKQPDAPILVVAGTDYLHVGWKVPSPENPEGIINYDIQYILESEPDKSDENWSTPVEVFNGTGLQNPVSGGVVESHESYDVIHYITSLEPNEEYYVRLRAKNIHGSGGWSYASRMRTLPIIRPSKPLPPLLALAGVDFIEVGWIAYPFENPEKITNYDLRYILNSETDKSDENWTVLEDVFVESPEISGEIILPNVLYHAVYKIGSTLTANTEYLVQLRSKRGEVHSLWSNSTLMSTLASGSPSQPSSPTLILKGSDFLDIAWEAYTSDNPEMIIDYDIRYTLKFVQDKSNEGNWALERGIIKPSSPNTDFGSVLGSNEFYDIVKRVSNLGSEKEYVIQIRARNSTGTGNWSFAVVMATTNANLPRQMSNPVLAFAGRDFLEVGWSIPPPENDENIINYDIRYILNSIQDKSDANWTEVLDILNASSVAQGVGLISEPSGLYDLKYRISGLQNNEEYLVQIRSKNYSGSSTWSHPSLMRTLRTDVLNSPSPPVLALAGGEFLDVGWKLPPPESSENITKYSLRYILTSEIDKSDNNWTVIPNILLSDYQDLNPEPAIQPDASYDIVYRLTGLSDGEDYFVQLKSINNDGDESNWSYAVVMSTILYRVPTKPRKPFLVLAGTNYFEIGWTSPDPNNVQEITNYDVRIILESETDRENGWEVFEDVAIDPEELVYLIENLETEETYLVQVRAKNRHGSGLWSREAKMATVFIGDHDKDNNGLIEISNFAQFNAMRYDTNGDGVVDNVANETEYRSSFPLGTVVNDMGCPSRQCSGYELTQDIDFEGQSWVPFDYDGVLNGKGQVINNFTVSSTNVDMALFLNLRGTVINLGIQDYDISGVTGNADIGVIAVINSGNIISCFTTGRITGTSGHSTSHVVGGVFARNRGRVTTTYTISTITGVTNAGLFGGTNYGEVVACYSYGRISTSRNAGGILSWNEGTSILRNSYTVSEVSGANGRTGGVLGGHNSGATHSNVYWDRDVSGLSNGVGSNIPRLGGVSGRTTAQLTTPTSYAGIYGVWNDADVIGDDKADDVWDFGNTEQYPILKIDFNQNLRASSAEFGNQRVLSPPIITSSSFANGRFTVEWSKPVVRTLGSIQSYSARYITETQSDWTMVSDITDGDSNQNSASLENLNTGTYYIAQIRPESANGSGMWSEPIYSNHSPTFMNFYVSKVFGREPILPDFSYAGYHYFEKPVPDVSTIGLQTFNVSDYGAVPNDGKSDHVAIQSAIDAAELAGGGIVMFASGEYLINTDVDYPGQIFIRASNIVLKGTGSRDGGTIIRQVNYLRSPSSSRENNPYAIVFYGRSGGSEPITVISKDARRETFWITVADASQLRAGQGISLNLQSVQAGRDYIAPYTIPNEWDEIRFKGAIVSEEHIIDKIEGDRVKLKEPIHTNIKASYLCEVRRFPHIEEVGIEDISLQGSFLEAFDHHRNDIHNSGWGIIQFDGCVNSWMRRVTVVNMSRLIIENSLGVSVYQITADGNPGHYFVRNESNYGLWFGLAEEKNHHTDNHNLNCIAHTTGTVYHSIRINNNAHYDSHSWFPYANLYDRVIGGRFNGAGGSIGSFPHHLRHLVIWNAEHNTNRTYNLWGNPNSYGQSYVYPIVVGAHGSNPPKFSNENQLEVLESNGTAVSPNSLFEAQLAVKLGSVPSWFEALKTEWETLKGQTFTYPRMLVKKHISPQEIIIGNTKDVDMSGMVERLHSVSQSSSSYSVSSSNTGIVTATVISSGLVTITAVAKGSAIITVTNTVNSVANISAFDVNVLEEVLQKPVGVSVQARNGGFDFHWHDPLSVNANDYNIRYRTNVSGSDWTNVNNVGSSGDLIHAVTGLANGTEYIVQVQSIRASESSGWSDDNMVTPVSSVDYDKDDDGLIEIYNFKQLNAVRYDLDGDGVGSNTTSYVSGFVDAVSGMGCPSSGCGGYELAVSLDFDNSAYSTGEGWVPIGDSTTNFGTVFEGNGNVLSSMTINRTSTAGGTGLFGHTSNSSFIRGVGLEGVNITESANVGVGGLVGQHNGTIFGCYVTGSVRGSTPDATGSGGSETGGLVGSTTDTIFASYSKANVVNGQLVGGFAGRIRNGGTLIACYATGSAGNGRIVGGMVGRTDNGASYRYSYALGRVTAGTAWSSSGLRDGGFFGHVEPPWGSRVWHLSYWDTQATGRSAGSGSATAASFNNSKVRSNILGRTTSQLQGQNSYGGIYGTWDDFDIDGDGTNDAPWDFGTNTDYPVLKIDFNGDNSATWEEFGTQR